MIDVSREKQAEEDLRRSDVFFKLALETASIAVFTQDDALRYTWVFDKLMGFNNAAVLGKTDLELGLDEAAVEESARFKRRVMQTGRQQTLDLDIPHPNGRLMSIRIVAEPYTLPNGEKGIIGASFDETGLKQAHRDLEQTANRLTLERVAADEATRAFRRQLNLRSQDMDDARILQLAMLPEVGSLLPEWDTFFHMETSQEVGGDYYDLYQRRTGELVVAVGDATGHGAKASIMVSAVKAFFQSLVPNVEPRIALEKISTGLQNMNLRNMFMGLTLLELHPDLSFKLSVAGMPPTLIYRAATGQVDQLHMRSLFLGTPLHKGFEQIDDRLQMGDVILLISDGMVETQDGDGRMMGFNTIVDLLKKLGTGTADEIGKGLIAHQAEIQGTRLLKDDTTLVVIKPGPGLAPSA